MQGASRSLFQKKRKKFTPESIVNVQYLHIVKCACDHRPLQVSALDLVIGDNNVVEFFNCCVNCVDCFYKRTVIQDRLRWLQYFHRKKCLKRTE
jgi:hypothetical protein